MLRKSCVPVLASETFNKFVALARRIYTLCGGNRIFHQKTLVERSKQIEKLETKLMGFHSFYFLLLPFYFSIQIL